MAAFSDKSRPQRGIHMKEQKEKKAPLYKSFGYAFEGIFMGLECVNTAVEAVVDLVTQERKPLAKKAKDAAAGAVLIAAMMAAVIGCRIFLPKILGVIM